MDLFQRQTREYGRIVLLDMHTGYGARDQMTLVGSCLEARSSARLQRQFCYPRAVKSDSTEFYTMQGDMIDYFYANLIREDPDKHFCGITFEFGTLGDSVSASVRSLRSMVLENRLYCHGTRDRSASDRIESDLAALYCPREESWRAKAIADTRQAFGGILSAEGFLA